MKKNIVIAIDGPAGSGKSTVAKCVAGMLSFLYVDTGAMYRALTLKALREGVPFDDEKKIVSMADKTKIELFRENGVIKIFMDGEDVGDSIRTEQVSKATRHIASILSIREVLWKLQRQLRKNNHIVMEGRDIGSKVFPDAQLKIFLDADTKERARRRHIQLKQMGIQSDADQIEEDIQARDMVDGAREIAPLKKLPDAVVIDTTNLTVEKAAKKIADLARKIIINETNAS